MQSALIVTDAETPEGIRENAKRKLEGYTKRFGVEEEDLVQPQNQVGMTRREMQESLIKIILKNAHKPKAAAFIRGMIMVAYDDEELERKLNQAKEYL